LHQLSASRSAASGEHAVNLLRLRRAPKYTMCQRRSRMPADRFADSVQVDRILTGRSEAVEDAGAKFKHSFWRPVQKASALVQELRCGLIFCGRAADAEAATNRCEQQEEELFI